MTTNSSAHKTNIPVSPDYKWAAVGMLWFICFFNYADRMAVSAIFPLLKAEYNFNTEELALIAIAFTWVYAATAPFAGQMSDRFPRKPIILGGLLIWSIVTGFTSICSKVWHFVLVRGSEGLGETFYFPASMSLVSDYHDRTTRSRAMSIHQTGVYAGTVGGSALAGYLGLHYGWRTPFVLFAICGVVLTLVLNRFLLEPRRNAAERALEKVPEEAVPPTPIPMLTFLAEWARTPTAVILLLAFFSANFVAYIFLTWMPTFLNEKFHQDVAKAAFGGTVFIQVASMIGASFGGVLADRWSRLTPGGRILSQALGALLGAPFIFLCGSTHDLGRLALWMTMFGLSKGLYDANIWASLYDVVPPSRRAAAVGLMNMVGWFGAGLGTWLIGRLTTRGMSMSAAISGTAGIYVFVACLMLAAGFFFAPRDIKRARNLDESWAELTRY